MVIYGCGGIVIKEGSVLLIRRIKPGRFYGLWSNPGGCIEEGESGENGTVRELLEELGIKVKIEYHISDFKDIGEEGLIGIYSGYLTTIIEGEPKIMEPENISHVDWFPLDNLPKDLAPYTKEYLNQILR